MAYPGTDWRKLSFAVFDARLRDLQHSRKYIDGTSDPVDISEAMADNDNRVILTKRRFRFIFTKV